MKKIKILMAVIMSLLLMMIVVGCSKDKAADDKNSKTVEQAINSVDKGEDTVSEPADNQDDSSDSSDMPKLDKEFQNCIIEMESLVMGRKQLTKMYRLKSKGRTDLIVDSKVVESHYSDFEKGTGYFYLPDDKSARKSSPQGGAVEYLIADLGSEINTKSMAKSGSENVNGFDCTIYKKEEGPYSFTGWVNEKNKLVIKFELKSIQDGKIGKSYTITKFQAGGVTEDMVTLPKDAQIQE